LASSPTKPTATNIWGCDTLRENRSQLVDLTDALATSLIVSSYTTTSELIDVVEISEITRQTPFM
jgi:hypothetical protein